MSIILLIVISLLGGIILGVIITVGITLVCSNSSVS